MTLPQFLLYGSLSLVAFIFAFAGFLAWYRHLAARELDELYEDRKRQIPEWLGRLSPGYRVCRSCHGLSCPEPNCPECHGDGEVPK